MKQISAGPMASPSRPSVRLTALAAPTITKIVKRTYPQPRSGSMVLKKGIVIASLKFGLRYRTMPMNRAIAISKTSRVRLEIPLLFCFVSLLKSSKNPMMPKPTVTRMSIHTKSLVRFAHSSVEITTEKMIMMPPMVGVPVFARCVPGPSSRMF